MNILFFHQILLKYICSMLDELLRSIGLSAKEATMYLQLLRNGTQPTSVLAKRAGFNRGTAYVVLHALLSKGLAVKATKRSVQLFGPVDPRNLSGYIDHREQELRDQRQRIEAVMGQFLAIKNPHSSQPKIEFYDGREGTQQVLEATLRAKEKLLRAYLSIADVIEFTGSEFFYRYTMKRIRNGQTLHAIRTLEKDRQAFASDKHATMYVTNRKQRREIRHVDDTLAFPISMYMFDDTIAIISSKEENFSVLIQSRELSSMQKKLFDLLWLSLRRNK